MDYTTIMPSHFYLTQRLSPDPGLNIRILNLSFGTDSLQSAQIDPLARQLLVSCGGAIEFARLAIRAAGRACAVDLLPDAGRRRYGVGATTSEDPGRRRRVSVNRWRT